MNNQLKNLQKEALLLKLSPTEKAALHANLMQAIARGQSAAAPTRMASPYFFFSPQLMGSFAALLLVILGGTTYAAQGTVPGDALYAVKTKVTEPIQGALAFSTEDKIKFHDDIAQVRLEEAEVLASQNRLDTKATETLESSIDTHLTERATLAAQLEEEKPGATLAFSSRIDSSITAHSDVLTQLGEGSASSSTKQNSNAIATKVRVAYAGNSRNSMSMNTMAFAAKATANADAVEPPQAPQPMVMSVSLQNDMVEATATMMATGAPEAQSANDSNVRKEAASNNSSSQDERKARSYEKRATSTLEELTRSAQKLEGKVDAETKAKVDARLSKIGTLVAEGQTAISSGEFELAVESFDEALDRSTTLSTFIGAQFRFNSGILKQLLGNDSRWGDD